MPAIRTRIERNGRILIPAAVRRDLGLTPGQEVTLSTHNGALIVTTPAAALAALRALVAGKVPKRVSLADDLIRERRAEKRRELAAERRSGATRA